MQFPNLDNLTLLLTFIVPGFVTCQAIRLFSVPSRDGNNEYLATYITLSAINFVIGGLLIPVANSGAFNLFWRFAAWAAYVFLVPFVTGIVIGTMIQRNFLMWVSGKIPLRWLGVRPLSHIPTAWDWKFGSADEEFVLIVLTDGTRFAGLLGPDSFISSEPAERDLYVQKLFEPDLDGNWQPTEKSLYVAKDEIRTVEFWPAEMNDGETQ